MGGKEDLISIVMPAYNCEKYVAEAISSVRAQSYTKWELLVIDDGSVDRTRRIIAEYAHDDARITLLCNEENRGVSATRNRGIESAKGEWIAFLDSDDMWDPAKLEKQIRVARRNKAEFIFTGSAYINEAGQPFKGILSVPEQVSYEKLRYHNVISCSSALLKKRFLLETEMDGDDIHEDYAAWLRILRTGVIAYGVNEPLLIYRLYRNSRSGNKIRTFKKTYGVFRLIGIHPLGSAYFTVRHVLGAIKKYWGIYQI